MVKFPRPRLDAVRGEESREIIGGVEVTESLRKAAPGERCKRFGITRARVAKRRDHRASPANIGQS